MSSHITPPVPAPAHPTTREYLWIITVRVDGKEITAKDTGSFPASVTRRQVFDAVLQRVATDLGKKDLPVLFFALEPNAL
ncbi:hypothetical protein [Streptomyces sp. NPDC015130]|uniref:hypothetical protein n=1 Tax=Streptomyces sp. NPDC015130 TaxID=3364940 RepID=UPI0036F6113D